MTPENKDNFVIEVSPEVWATIKRQISEEDIDSINLLYSPYWRRHESPLSMTPTEQDKELREAMNTLLSDQELRGQILEILGNSIGDITDDADDIVTLINTQKRLYAESVINEPSDTVKKGDTAFTALEKFRTRAASKTKGSNGRNNDSQ